MATEGRQQDDFAVSNIVVIVALVLCLNPIIAIVDSNVQDPSILVELGEEVDEPETFLALTKEYTPSSVVTFVNDTPGHIGSAWSGRYWGHSNSSMFKRYLNIPLWNISEVIIAASFVVQEGSRFIGIEIVDHDDTTVSYAANSTHSYGGENVTLTLRKSPEIFRGYQSGAYLRTTVMIIEVEGDYRDGIEISGFRMQAALNGAVYPVRIDIQRTNGVSLFSYPTTAEIDLSTSYLPELKFTSSDLDIGGLHLFQNNETFLLPSAMYNITFHWVTYWLNSSYFHSEEENVIVWRVRSVRLDVRLTQNVPQYGIGMDLETFGEGIMIGESLSFCLPPDRNYSVYVQGVSWARALIELSTGRNLNITIWVQPNMLNLVIAALSPGRLLMIVFSVLAVSMIAFGIRKYQMDYIRLIPFSLLPLSYILPWVGYTIEGFRLKIVPEDYYLISWNDYPGMASSTSQISDSAVLMTPASFLITPFMYLLLFCALWGALPSDNPTGLEPKKSNLVFPISLCLILLLGIIHILYILGRYGTYHYSSVTPGIGLFLAALALISWIALQVQRAARALPAWSSTNK